MPSDQLEQGWWVQDCAAKINIKSERSLQRDNPKASARCLGQLNLPNPDPKCLTNTSTNIGVDLADARRVCAHEYNRSSKDQSPRNGCSSDSGAGTAACEPQLVDIGTNDDITGDSAYFQPRKVPYENWSPRAQAIFRELTLAVVAGIHIQEQTAASPTLTSRPTARRTNAIEWVKLPAARGPGTEFLGKNNKMNRELTAFFLEMFQLKVKDCTLTNGQFSDLRRSPRAHRSCDPPQGVIPSFRPGQPRPPQQRPFTNHGTVPHVSRRHSPG